MKGDVFSEKGISNPYAKEHKVFMPRSQSANDPYAASPDSPSDNRSSVNAGVDVSGFSPKTDEERAKQKKNRKWELIVGAIADGVSSFSNLFFTTKGAPSMIQGKQPTLTERIYGRHRREDADYNNMYSAWEKEQRRKQKGAEKIAKENERLNIHSEYSPLLKNWDNDDYVNLLYEDLQKEIFRQQKNKGMKTSKLLDELTNSVGNYSTGVQPYIKRTKIQSILDGSFDGYSDEAKSEFNADAFSSFRNDWNYNDSNFGK